MNQIALVVCLHGDEPFGLEVGKEFQETLPVFIGNELALKQNKRFIEADLNRCFPGNPEGEYEEKIAYELLKKLKNFDYIIDVHSSSCNIELFGIITKPNKEKINLAKKMGLKKIVLMSEHLAKGSALIDYLDCALSLEIGPHNKEGNAEKVITLINNLQNNIDKDCSENKPEIYEIFDIIKGEEVSKYYLENFKGVKKGDLIAEGKERYYAHFDFIPILTGEDAYNNIICLAAKSIQ